MMGDTLNSGAVDGSAVDGGALDGGALDGNAHDGSALDGGALDGGALDGNAHDGSALDGGALDGGAHDGGALDGGALDGGALDGGALDGGALDGGALDGGALDGNAHDGNAHDGSALDGGALDGGALDGGALDGGALDGGALDGGALDGNAHDGNAHDGSALDGGALDGGAHDGGALDGGALDGSARNSGALNGSNLNGRTLNGDNPRRRVLRIGIIGCGEIAQVSHIPTLNAMSDYFRITYLCDISSAALEHGAGKVAGSRPKITTKAEELCASVDVDAVLICNATPLHTTHAILALRNNKHVLVEKPLALCYRDLDALEDAENSSQGSVFVGYMRRYAPAFLQAMTEVGDGRVQYARVRDIIGTNSTFVDQSGTFPKKFNDFAVEDSEALQRLENEIVHQALCEEFGLPVTDQMKRMLLVLGGLGSHDLSAMREALGMPQAVIGADLGWPIWSAMFKYPDFTVVYESGINSVPVFDAHIEVYTDDKIVRVDYDTPYIKGLPTTVMIRERVEGTGVYQERRIRPTYEDSYTVEFRHWHDCITSEKRPKTTVADAREDLDVFKMLMQAAFKK